MTDAALDIPSEPVAAEQVAEAIAAEPSQVEQQETKPERTFTQAELDAKIEKRLSKERSRYERETAERIARLEGQLMQREPEPKPNVNAPPKIEDFNDLDSYIKAQASYEAGNIVEQKLSARERERQEAEDRRHHESVVNSARERMEAARDKYDDFDDVMESPAPISGAMAQIIANTADGMELAYHLAKNPHEAARIAKLDPYSAALEMGELRVRLKTPAKPSAAPEPIEPAGSKAKAEKSPNDMSQTEFEAWRKKFIKRR